MRAKKSKGKKAQYQPARPAPAKKKYVELKKVKSKKKTSDDVATISADPKIYATDLYQPKTKYFGCRVAPKFKAALDLIGKDIIKKLGWGTMVGNSEVIHRLVVDDLERRKLS